MIIAPLLFSLASAQNYNYVSSFRSSTSCSINPVSLIGTVVTVCNVTAPLCTFTNQTYQYSVQSCTSATPASTAANMFGTYHYAGYTLYSDAACTTPATKYVFSLADNSCVNIDSQSSVMWWLVAANQVAMNNFNVINCTGTATTVSTINTGACIAFNENYAIFNSANYNANSPNSGPGVGAPPATAAPVSNSGYGMFGTSLIVLALAYGIAFVAQ